MKTIRLFFMAALTLMLAACSTSDDELTAPQPQPAAEGIPFSATVSSSNSPVTRALTVSGTAIGASWAEGEEVAVIHGGIVDKMTVTSVDGGKATISGTLNGTPGDGDEVTVIYPYSSVDLTTGDVKADLLSSGVMDGTLESISTSCDVRKSTGVKLKIDGTTATFSAAATMKALYCIFKFTIQDLGGSNFTVNSMDVRDADGNLLSSAKLSSGASEIYMALDPTATTVFRFFPTKSGNVKGAGYARASASTLAAGAYYESPIKIARVDDYILKNGSFANGQTNTTPANVVARITYVGPDADTSYPNKYNGIAIALSNATVAEGMSGAIDHFVWCNQGSAKCLTKDLDGIENTKALVANTAHNHAAAKAAAAYSVDGFTPSAHGFSDWFLPSYTQYEKSAKYRSDPILNMEKKLGMNGKGCTYWTSTEVDEANAYILDGYPIMSPEDKTKDYDSSLKLAVRAAIAF